MKDVVKKHFLPRQRLGGSLTGFTPPFWKTFHKGQFHSFRTKEWGGSSKRAGFTFIEIIIVISVIIILAGLTLVLSFSFIEDGKTKAAESLIKNIEMALTNYKEVFLEYPPGSGQWDGSQNIYYFLTQKLEYQTSFDPVLKTAETKEFRADLNLNNKNLDAQKYIIDGWDNRLVYQCPGLDHKIYGGKNNKSYVDLESFGPNGLADDDNSQKNDDINNWQK
ncbi:MAG: hypothetical protein AAB019_06970 [Planctomycetota bacterium]